MCQAFGQRSFRAIIKLNNIKNIINKHKVYNTIMLQNNPMEFFMVLIVDNIIFYITFPSLQISFIIRILVMLFKLTIYLEYFYYKG
jgi:hypothetical protein